MSTDVTCVLRVRDSLFLPSIAQLHAIAEFFAASGYIDDAMRKKLDTEFDILDVDGKSRVRVDEGDIDIGYYAKNIPWFGSRDQAMSIYVHKHAFVFSIAEIDAYLCHSLDQYELLKEMSKDSSLVELELQLSKILGTEVVSAVIENDSFLLPEPRMDDSGLPAPNSPRKPMAKPTTRTILTSKSIPWGH